MRWPRLLTIGVVAVMATMLASVNEAGETAGKQVAKQFSKDKYTFNYLLYLPEGYGKDAKKWPVMMFLHGGGETGTDLNKVKIHGPPKIAEAKKYPFIVVSPQSPGKGWQPEGLNMLLDDVLAKYNCDPDRVYLTGLSMGGAGTWSFATAYPERFAALVPICGRGDIKKAAKLKDMPIWVFHGAKDTTVPLKGSEEMVAAIKEAGGKNVKFTVYPDAQHDSWTVTYNNPELYKWLLEQKRPAKK